MNSCLISHSSLILSRHSIKLQIYSTDKCVLTRVNTIQTIYTTRIHNSTWPHEQWAKTFKKISMLSTWFWAQRNKPRFSRILYHSATQFTYVKFVNKKTILCSKVNFVKFKRVINAFVKFVQNTLILLCWS